MAESSGENRRSNDVLDDYDKSKFDHIFSGWSVWIEPEDDDMIDHAMAELQTACGGPASGAASFVPHVTLMYNLPPFREDETSTTKRSNNPQQDRLQACWDEFVKKKYGDNQQQTTTNIGDDDDGDHLVLSSSSQKTIVPTEWYSFHYPKSADDGKGFGCSIALLLIEPTEWLVSLQEICRKILGPDERSKFTPHLSLVYAPEDRSDYLKEYVETKQQADKVLLEGGNNKATKTTTVVDHVVIPPPTATYNGALPVKFLSLWSTQGRIQDWYRIAKIPIS
jgi:2'-5' RNA ligase